MAEVMALILKYAFTELALHKVEGFVETENINCKRALKKLNFKLEETLVDCEEKNGELISLEVYSINASKTHC